MHPEPQDARSGTTNGSISPPCDPIRTSPESLVDAATCMVLLRAPPPIPHRRVSVFAPKRELSGRKRRCTWRRAIEIVLGSVVATSAPNAHTVPPAPHREASDSAVRICGSERPHAGSGESPERPVTASEQPLTAPLASISSLLSSSRVVSRRAGRTALSVVGTPQASSEPPVPQDPLPRSHARP